MDKKLDKQQEFVLACIDGSSAATAVCDYSSWIAKSIDAPVKLLHTIEHKEEPVVTDYSGAIGLGTSEELLNELTELEKSHSRLLIEKGQLMLQAAREKVTQAGVDTVEIRQRHGCLSEALVDMEAQIDVLVLGIRGEEHGEEQTDGLGTQLETVIRSLHKPILVVNREYSEPKKVMLAYDGSESCIKALGLIASSELFKAIPCHIVHVGNGDDKSESLLIEASKVLESVDIPVTTAQINGKVEEVLTQYQRDNDIDLMIMGAFSHNRFRDFLLGSFTAKMLAATRRPLLLLR